MLALRSVENVELEADKRHSNVLFYKLLPEATFLGRGYAIRVIVTSFFFFGPLLETFCQSGA